jgi:cytidylate kinase
MVKVTIFGLAATGKSTVSKLLCDDLNLKYMSTGNMFREEASRRGLSVYEFDSLCKSDLKYDIELDNSVKVYGENKDNFIFESRLAWYFIPDSIKIKLDCDLDTRINRVIERDGGEFDESKKLTLQRELDTVERYTKLYNLANFAADENYDYVIDTSTIGIGEVVNLIREIILNNSK